MTVPFAAASNTSIQKQWGRSRLPRLAECKRHGNSLTAAMDGALALIDGKSSGRDLENEMHCAPGESDSLASRLCQPEAAGPPRVDCGLREEELLSG